jgi:hypothetical protein
MKKALIVYHSRTGTTKLFGEEIRDFFNKNQIESKAVSAKDLNQADLASFDFILFGCWTKGLLICRQHPEKVMISLKSRNGHLSANNNQELLSIINK